jgi:hypothetical protein
MFEIAFLLVLALQTAGEDEERKLSADYEIVEVSLNTLRRVCPTKKQIHGCTRFVEPELFAECVVSDGIWSMRTRARYKPLVFVSNQKIIGHEYLHLIHMRRSVTAHLRKLERGTYASEASCKEAAEASSAGFHSKMQEFARQSQEHR